MKKTPKEITIEHLQNIMKKKQKQLDECLVIDVCRDITAIRKAIEIVQKEGE